MGMRFWIPVLIASLLLTAVAIFVFNRLFPELPLIGTETAVVFAGCFLVVFVVALIIKKFR
jgi:hypothetical protein